ncbi:MAG: heme-dependent oxidative N-demethylase subunit alpha family protein [Fimbriimonas sp.]
MDRRPRYTPWMKGVYEVVPALKPLGFDFGHGVLDGLVFQFGEDFAAYRTNKERAVHERAPKYSVRDRLPREMEAALVRRLSQQIAEEHPDLFAWEGTALRCHLTGALVTDDLDAFAMQVQPDIAIVRRSQAEDWIAALHLCAPSHWAAEDKVGKSFLSTHESIPGMDRVNTAAAGLVEAMIRRGPWVRFVWGVESDDRLNHHPVAPMGVDPADWNGRLFHRGRFFVRTERQVIVGFPDLEAALFTIQVQHIADKDLSVEELVKLGDALRSMTPEARRYKGVDVEFGILMGLIEARIGNMKLASQKAQPLD